MFGSKDDLTAENDTLRRLNRDLKAAADSLRKAMTAAVDDRADQREKILDLENRLIELEDRRRVEALTIASQSGGGHGLPEEITARAKEYFEWLLEDWREDSAVKNMEDLGPGPASKDGVGDNPINPHLNP